MNIENQSHPERSEGSTELIYEILRYAQNDITLITRSGRLPRLQNKGGFNPPPY